MISLYTITIKKNTKTEKENTKMDEFIKIICSSKFENEKGNEFVE